MGRLLFFLFPSCLLAQLPVYLDNISPDHPKIRYTEGESDDSVSSLLGQIQAGNILLDRQDNHLGYLPDLLSKLKIPIESQMLVFSKTSLQAHRISPSHPRAIYFNENVAVGWIPGAPLIEIIAHDPESGAAFYTLDAQKIPAFQRQQHCLSCHQGPATLGVPGVFVGSAFTNALGIPFRDSAIITDHRTSFAERWGGWYITAKKGQRQDRSNSFWLDSSGILTQRQPINPLGTINQSKLPRIVNAEKYLTDSSDIVALMVFEHQTLVSNLLTRLKWESRIGLDIDTRIKETTDALLFRGEPQFTEPLEGSSSFAKVFSSSGFRDEEGKSLKDFDLVNRLFRYPLSYMIDSRQFSALPAEVKKSLYKELYNALTASSPDKKLSHLSSSDKKTLLNILHKRKLLFLNQ